MMPSAEHLAVIAAAGSRKTEFVVNEALAHDDKRVLITTYTLNNLACTEDRIYGKACASRGTSRSQAGTGSS